LKERLYQSVWKGAWTPENLDATIPVVEKTSNFSTSNVENSFYVEDGILLEIAERDLGLYASCNLIGEMEIGAIKSICLSE